MYFFGSNDEGSYPFHTRFEWMDGRNCADKKFLNGKYRCNDGQYESVKSALFRAPGQLYSNILQLNECISGQNTIG